MLERFAPIFHAANPDNKHHIDHLLAFIQENDTTLAHHGAHMPWQSSFFAAPFQTEAATAPTVACRCAGRYAFLLHEARGSHRRVRAPPGLATVGVREVRGLPTLLE